MLKKSLWGLLWAAVFYLGTCMVIGMVAGFVAGVRNPTRATEAGALAGAQVVAPIRIYIALAAVALAAVGMGKGFLPGGKRNPSTPPPLPKG